MTEEADDAMILSIDSCHGRVIQNQQYLYCKTPTLLNVIIVVIELI